MSTHAGPVKRRVEAADLQTDVTDTDNSKRAKLAEPDRQGHKAQNLQLQNTHLNNANNISKDHGAELSNSIECLPGELMTKIFRKLNCRDKVSVACVCFQWRHLIDIPSVWRDSCPSIDVDSLTSVHIHKMNIRKISKVQIYKCTSVEKMTTFLQGVPDLKNLSCIFAHFLTDLFPGELNFPGIKQLTINCFELSTGVLRSFLQPMGDLQYLRLHCIPQQDIVCALQHSKNLVSLEINCRGCRVILSVPTTGDLNPVSDLEHLTLVNLTVGDSFLEFISRAFPQLCSLKLMLSPDVTSGGLKKLAKLKQLKKLNIRSDHFEHGWIKHLNTELPQLQDLSLHGCPSISNECLQSISKLPGVLALSIPIWDREVESLLALSQGCSGLQILCLGYGNRSINTGLHEINSMPNLQELILDTCLVNDDFWRKYSESFSKLRRLSFIKCQLVSEQCLPYLSQMACLEKLLLERCKAFGNESIKHLGELGKFNSLTCITLIELGIKNDCLVELSKITPCLKKLVIKSCENVTEEGLAEAVSKLSHLEVLVTRISAGTKDRLKRIRPHLQFHQM